MGTLGGFPIPPATNSAEQSSAPFTRSDYVGYPPRADSYCSCITNRPEMFMAVTVAR